MDEARLAMRRPFARRAVQGLVALVALACLWPPAGWRARHEQLRPPVSEALGGVARLLGPFAGLAASAQWVRFDLALRNGEPERALAIAQQALTLDPGAWQGWFTLGSHLAFDRASAIGEPRPEQRRHWVESGLEVFARGIERARAADELRALRGSLLVGYVAPLAGELEWPGGALAALDAGIEDLERAAARGHRGASELATAARESRDSLEAGIRPPDWPE